MTKMEKIATKWEEEQLDYLHTHLSTMVALIKAELKTLEERGESEYMQTMDEEWNDIQDLFATWTAMKSLIEVSEDPDYEV